MIDSRAPTAMTPLTDAELTVLAGQCRVPERTMVLVNPQDVWRLVAEVRRLRADSASETWDQIGERIAAERKPLLAEIDRLCAKVVALSADYYDMLATVLTE